MKTATITEAKNHLSALIHAVRNGETVIVLDRKTPVARIESIARSGTEETDNRLDRLQRQGMILRAKTTCIKSILEDSPPRPKGNVRIVDALLKERSEGR